MRPIELAGLRGFSLLALDARDVQQIQMLGGLSALSRDVDPVLHQQRVFRIFDGDMSAVAHHNRKWNEWCRLQHFLQFFLHESYLRWFRSHYMAFTQKPYWHTFDVVQVSFSLYNQFLFKTPSLRLERCRKNL